MTRRNLTNPPEWTVNRRQSQRLSRLPSTSPYDPLDEVWPPPLGESAMVSDYDANQIEVRQSLQLSDSTFPPSADLMAPPRPTLASSSAWNIAPALCNEISSTTELPWTFQDGGIFGLPNEIYPGRRDKYFDPFEDDYYQRQEHRSTPSWDFVSMPWMPYQNNFLPNESIARNPSLPNQHQLNLQCWLKNRLCFQVILRGYWPSFL